MSSSSNVFLKHVVGLRGIAILLVLFFHAANKYCQCGHFGVDVFFVVSGYFLWTGIHRAQASGTFSFAEFYRKKVFRIFPLLISLILVLFPVVVWLTTLSVRQAYGETSLASLFGLSNEYLEFFTMGYFGFGCSNNLLRHTWYLSVILQMYLMLPVLIVLFKRCANWLRHTFWILLFVVSFLAFHHQPAFTQNTPEAPGWLFDYLYSGLCHLLSTDCLLSYASPYYWTLGRIWELLAGAAIPCLPIFKKECHAPLALFGLALVLIPSFTFTPGSLFVLPVVCGTMLVFRYGAHGLTGTLLTNKVLFWVGTISFSLYIWHWPVCLLWFSLVRGSHDWISYSFIVSISFLMAWVAWKYVETRRFSSACIAVTWLAALLLAAALAPSGGASWKILGIPHQIVTRGYHESKACSAHPILMDVPDIIRPATGLYGGGIYKNSIWEDLDDELLLSMGTDSAKSDFLMVGDSHANSLYPALDTFCKEKKISGVYLRSYIAPLPGWYWSEEFGEPCCVSPEKTEAFMKWMERHPEITKIIIGQAWHGRLVYYTSKRLKEGATREEALCEFEAMLEQTCTRLRRAGKKVGFFSQVPTLLRIPLDTDVAHMINSRLLKGCTLDLTELSVSRSEYLKYSQQIREILERLQNKGLCSIIHQDASLFENGLFSAYRDGDIMLRDGSHLTMPGAMKALEGMRDELTDFLLANPGQARE